MAHVNAGPAPSGYFGSGMSYAEGGLYGEI